MKEVLHILKIGGNVLGNDLVLASVLNAFSKKEGRKIIVHGGGKKATVLAEKLGIPSVFIDGRRITDTDALEIAVMTYAGWYNKKIVAHCHSIGLSSLGLSGADANAILSIKRPVKEVDFGWVGDPVNVNVETLTHFMNIDLTLVFCAVTHDGQGQLLNTNADTIASTLATAFSSTYSVNLTYCLELPGVLEDVADSSTVIPSLNRSAFIEGREKGYFHAGMIPKLENAFNAIENGVTKVVICGPDSFLTNGGTHICK
ncbi:MAG: acetylglutamate kinase [Bacteroidota bacterium]